MGCRPERALGRVLVLVLGLVHGAGAAGAQETPRRGVTIEFPAGMVAVEAPDNGGVSVGVVSFRLVDAVSGLFEPAQVTRWVEAAQSSSGPDLPPLVSIGGGTAIELTPADPARGTAMRLAFVRRSDGLRVVLATDVDDPRVARLLAAMRETASAAHVVRQRREQSVAARARHRDSLAAREVVRRREAALERGVATATLAAALGYAGGRLLAQAAGCRRTHASVECDAQPFAFGYLVGAVAGGTAGAALQPGHGSCSASRRLSLALLGTVAGAVPGAIALARDREQGYVVLPLGEAAGAVVALRRC